MLKKFLILLPSLLFISSVQASHEEDSCYISGKVKLPNAFFSKAKVNMLDQNVKIEKDGFYCIEESIRERDKIYLTVINKHKKVILKNPIFKSEINNKEPFNITLERAFAEVVCDNRLCSEEEIRVFEKNNFIKDYKTKLLKTYYDDKDNNTRFKYEKVIRKMENQSFRIHRKEEKTSKQEREISFFPLENVKAKNYDNFYYSKRDRGSLIQNYLNNNDVYVGLDNKNENYDIIILNWIRYIYYYGDQIEDVGALYSKKFKYEILEKNELEKPLILSQFYKSNAREKTFVRPENDLRFYKKSIPEISKHFQKNGSFILNKKPDFVNIEFIYENGAWRLDTFDINKEYYNYLNNL